jgi:hypothetical protein
MKTLKITLALVAVLVLTVSGVQSENVNVVDEQPTYETKAQYDIIAHTKTRLKKGSNG